MAWPRQRAGFPAMLACFDRHGIKKVRLTLAATPGARMAGFFSKAALQPLSTLNRTL
jgi:hypothetical protein